MSRYMSEQEQEHFDHVAGSASEFQNCFSEAQDMRCHLAAKHYKPIADVLAAGRFAVVSTAPYFCKATDAFAGVVEYLRGDFATRAEADAAAFKLYQDEYALGFDIGEDLYVLPRVPLAVVIEAEPSDDVPF